MSEYFGIYKGLVVDDRDPENRGRLVVQIPQVLGDTRSNWCEPIQEIVYAATPDPGQTVWVMFANGDLAQPVWFSPDMVNAAKIIAGSVGADAISADYAYVGALQADQIIGGTFRANLVLAATMVAGIEGANRVENGPDGIIVYNEAGAPFIILPTGAGGVSQTASFKGDLEADSLTITGGMALRSTGDIAGGASLVLRSTTTRPVSAPTAVVDWENTVIDTSASPLGAQFGLTWNGTNFYTVDNTATIWQHTYPASAPVEIATLNRPNNLVNNLSTLTYIGGYFYSVAQYFLDGYYFAIEKFDPSGNMVASIQYDSVGSGSIVVGTDGTSLIVAEWDSVNKKYRIQTRSQVDLSLISTITTVTNSGFTGNLVGVMRGNFDFGATRFIVLSSDGTLFRTFDSAGNYQAADAWAVPSGGVTGFAWDGTRFYTLKAGGGTGAQIVKHTTYKQGTTDPHTLNVTATWLDSDSGGTGVHETDMGPARAISMKKRARLTLTAPTIPDLGDPDDPDSVAFYLSNTTTARTSFWRQILPDVGRNSLAYGDFINFSGTNPPATNNFPTKPPGKITNEDSSLVISSDGSIKAKTATVNGDTTITGKILAKDAIYSVAYSGTTDSTGILTVTHGAGFTPAGGWAVTGNPVSSFAVFWGITAITATTVQIRFMNAAGGGALASTAVAGRLYLVRP